MAADLKTILIAIVLFTGVGVALLIPITEINTNYNRTVSGNFSAAFNEFDTQLLNAQAQTATIENTTKGESASGETTSGFTFSNAIAGFKLIFTFGGFVDALATTISGYVGIPAVFVTILMTIVIILITLIFIAAIFGRRLD